MDHVLERVVGANRMSMIDGFSGYNQITMNEQDKEKTAFTTPWGTFMYDKMPFGLMNAGGYLPARYGYRFHWGKG
jgi:hypothetical protein